jgi:hypothetical protein
VQVLAQTLTLILSPDSSPMCPVLDTRSPPALGTPNCVGAPEGGGRGRKGSPTATRVEPQLFSKIFLIFFACRVFLGANLSKTWTTHAAEGWEGLVAANELSQCSSFFIG